MSCVQVVVTGGRNYTNYSMVTTALERLNPDVVISGDATGVDALAKAWAMTRHKTYIGYPANWKDFGLAAGPIRNRKMLEAHPLAIVLAFPGGAGTTNCITNAVDLGMEVIEVCHTIAEYLP